MVRLFVDKLGTGQNDLFLKIEDELIIADSYYLSEFLKIENENDINTSLICSHLIDYWVSIIAQIEINKPLFLPFDLSDQYVGGLLIKKTIKYISLKYVYTEGQQGYGISKSSFNEIISMNNSDIQEITNKESLVNNVSILIESLNNSKLHF